MSDKSGWWVLDRTSLLVKYSDHQQDSGRKKENEA